MELIRLEDKDITKIYNEYMQKDFDHSELKPLKMIIERKKVNKYDCFALVEEEVLAYAFFAFKNEEDMALLDYYAVVEKYRGKGYGNIMLAKLKEKFKNGIIAEVEIPEYAKSDIDRLKREGRIIFYQKCGLIKTNINVNVFAHEYHLFYTAKEQKSNEYIKNIFSDIYLDLLGKELRDKNIKYI